MIVDMNMNPLVYQLANHVPRNPVDQMDRSSPGQTNLSCCRLALDFPWDSGEPRFIT